MSDLFWLTGIEQAESILVLAPDATNPAHREMLFIREPNANLEIWEGHSLTKQEAQSISGLKTILWSENFSWLWVDESTRDQNLYWKEDEKSWVYFPLINPSNKIYYSYNNQQWLEQNLPTSDR